MVSSSHGPRWRVIAILIAVVLAVGSGAVIAACGVGTGVGDGGVTSTTTTTGDGSETTEPSGSTTTKPSSPDPGQTSTTTSGSATTTTGAGSVTTTTAGQDTMTVNVYFARDEKIATAVRVIPKTQATGAAAMRALLDGPTSKEAAAGMASAIPEGTTFLGLNIRNGVATVDLSKEYGSGGGSLSMMMRLAQVVFTLTQFPSVQGVQFMLDGKPISVLGGEGVIIDHPMTRGDYEDLSPAILVESPGLGAAVASPVRVTGTANTFEATFMINIVNREGLILVEDYVTATSGTGTRGTFDVTLKYPAGHAGPGAIIVFESSAKDGSPINVVEIPIVLR